MLHLWLVLMTLAALALAVQVPAVDNDDWHVDGQRAVLPVQGCTQFKGALLLYPGSAAMYRFNGTSVAVLGAVYEEGAEALIELEGQQRRVNAQSRQRKCAQFARFDNLNAGTLHTIRISVSGGQGGGRRAVFPLIALDITPPAGSGQLPPGQPSSGPKPPDPPPNPAPPADPTTDPLPTRPVTPIPSSTDDADDDDNKPTSSSTRKPDSSMPTNTPDDDTNPGEDEEDQDSTLTEQPPSSSVDGPYQPPLTVDSDTFTASNDSPSPSGSPDPSLDNTNTSASSSSGSSGPKANTLVPAILIPILILLALGTFAIWFIRRRRRNRLPPSAEWRMANPNYEAGGGYGSSEQMGEVVQPWAPPTPSGYGADGRPWSPFHDDGRRY